MRPVPTAVYSRHRAGDAMMACLIAPLREAKKVPVIEPIDTNPQLIVDTPRRVESQTT